MAAPGTPPPPYPHTHPDNIPPDGGPSEVVRLGEEIFERDVLPTLPADPPGHTIIIDVDGGGWEIDPDEVAAAERFAARRPHGRGYLRRLDSAFSGRIGFGRGPASAASPDERVSSGERE